MTEIRDQETIGQIWTDAVRSYGPKPFICIPANPDRDYAPRGLELTYRDANETIQALGDRYASAGYGLGSRVSLLLENRPEHVLHRLALNCIGASVVPVNPDYRPSEFQYLIDHCQPDLVLTTRSRLDFVEQVIATTTHRPLVQDIENQYAPPSSRRRTARGEPDPTTESQILYTSGTTGRPKGCIISHGYEVSCGDWYRTRPGRFIVREGLERIYNPLPLYHINSGVVSLVGAILSGSCQIQPDRFHPARWWPEVIATRATIVHYLGVIIQMLMKQEPAPYDHQHTVTTGFGAGVEPQLHAAFEARFGFPLVEVWGMTEMVRVLCQGEEPRRIGSRAFGRAVPGIEIRVVDDRDSDVPDGTPGEMILRHSQLTPRRGAFSGYLKDEPETEKAWRGGWFHTGDTVTRAADGTLYFVDRKKNIIRRSGENIAAAEVEAALLTHPDILQVAVLAVKDETREEEVLACIVLRSGTAGVPLAEAIFRFANERLTYYKAPGWIWFTDDLPKTGTQKIQKHTIFPGHADPRTAPGMIDLRGLKRRQ